MPKLPKKRKHQQRYNGTKIKPSKEVLEEKDAKLQEIAKQKEIKAPKFKAIPLKENEIPIWYFKPNVGDWKQFPSSVSRRIEEGYQDERTSVSVDFKYDLLFESMLKVKKADKYIYEPVKREIEICTDPTRREAFCPPLERTRIFEGLRPLLFVESDEYLDDWTTERDPEEEKLLAKEKKDKKKKPKSTEEEDEEEDDFDVENAVDRSSVRVGLPIQSIASRQARKLQTILEGVTYGEYTWQAFVIQIPENAEHLDIEHSIRRALQIPDLLVSNYSIYPKICKDFFSNEDEDQDESSDSEQQKRELATKTAVSFFQKVFNFEFESTHYLSLPKFVGGRVQQSHNIAGVYTIKMDLSM